MQLKLLGVTLITRVNSSPELLSHIKSSLGSALLCYSSLRSVAGSCGQASTYLLLARVQLQAKKYSGAGIYINTVE